MGDAEERLVLDYLGRVADLAHGRLTPEARVAFLGRLRAGIEEQRAGRDGGMQHTLDVLDRLGEPKELVEAESLRLISEELRDGDERVARLPGGAAVRGGRRRRKVNAADLRRRTRTEREPPPWRRERTPPVRDRTRASHRAGRGQPSGLVAEGFNPVSGAEAIEILRTHRRESVALLLIGVGGLVFPYLFWPVGAFLVLRSLVWFGPEKWIGLASPLVIAALAVISTGSSRANPRAGTDFFAYWTALLDVGPTAFRLAALGGAAYLFFRLIRTG